MGEATENFLTWSLDCGAAWKKGRSGKVLRQGNKYVCVIIMCYKIIDRLAAFIAICCSVFFYKPKLQKSTSYDFDVIVGQFAVISVVLLL